MCLLVTQPEGVVFDKDFLEGVYQLNSDGIGVMYADGSTLYHAKFLPKKEADFVAFYEQHIKGRNCAWHARMKTHGHIDMGNCHPYEVISADEGYPLYLMHNGMLHTGNKADVSKSDTWHYIQNFLRPMLLKNPEFFMDPAFTTIIGEHIGHGNKFVLLDAYGNMVTINEEQGLYHNGAWLSNDYAWDTTGTEHDTLNYRGAWKNWSSIQQGSFVAGPQDEEIEDREQFCDAVFDALKALNMDRAYKALTYRNLEDYYEHAGVSLSWTLVDSLEYGAYTDDEFLDEIRSYDKEVNHES